MNAITFSDVLIKPKYSEVTSRSNVDLTTDMGKFKLRLPIISANMKHITGEKMAAELSKCGGLGILHRFNTVTDNREQYIDAITPECLGKPRPIVGVSIGVKKEDIRRFRLLYHHGARIFCIDVAHGHHILVKNMIDLIRQESSNDVCIIAGNIATSDAIYDLANWGADIVKVGIGPGSVCQTRNKTGVGVPQLSALEECSNQLLRQNKHVKIIADGGIQTPGDIAKALKYADAVMIGSMIAGTSETPGNVYKDVNNQYYKVYGGSASGENKGESKFVEGMTKQVPFKGHVKYILREIEQGLQSAFSYVGASNVREYKDKCEFITITNAGTQESKM